MRMNKVVLRLTLRAQCSEPKTLVVAASGHSKDAYLLLWYQVLLMEDV